MDKSDIQDEVLEFQKTEITLHEFYKRLAKSVKGQRNRDILKSIAADELAHYEYWKDISEKEVKPRRMKLLIYTVLSWIFGITFSMKLMERHEKQAQRSYEIRQSKYQGINSLLEDEVSHEEDLINLIDERRLRYTGAIIRGINDGVVEITGEIIGLSLIFHESRLVGFIALISGSVGSLSLASSEYLAAFWEENQQTPLGAASYTVVAYMITLVILIWPLLIGIPSVTALPIVVFNAVILIFLFNYHLSIAKDMKFSKRFLHMLIVSLGVALVSFILGLLIRYALHIEI